MTKPYLERQKRKENLALKFGLKMGDSQSQTVVETLQSLRPRKKRKEIDEAIVVSIKSRLS